MKKQVQCGITAGLAIAGASAVAITPIAPITPSTATTARVTNAPVELAADFSGLSQAELVSLTVERLADQFPQAGVEPLLIAIYIATGDNEKLYSTLKQNIDAPLYVADPLIEALAQILPESLGGGTDHITTQTSGDGALMQFRNVEILGIRDQAHQILADALGGVDPKIDVNYSNILAKGLQESATNVANGVALGLLGAIPVAEAVASGDNVALYGALRQYNDAPLWAADPAIEAFADVLPESLGGNTAPGANDGGLMEFRDEKLWGATHQGRLAIADALNVTLDNQDNPVNPQPVVVQNNVLGAKQVDSKKISQSGKTTELTAKLDKKTKKVGAHRKVASHATPGSHVKKALGKAETRANKAAQKVKDSVKKLSKKADAD